MKRIALHAAAASLLAIGAVQAAEITIYKQPNFSGGEMTLRDTRTDLAGSGFTDQASSAVVRSGRWQVCTQPNFQGECTTLAPGQYASLDPKVFHRIESMRPIDVVAENESTFPRGERGYGERRYGERGYRGGDIELYAGTDYRGQRMRLRGDRDMLSDDRYGLGISSLVVNEGTWQLCTRPGYTGRCEVFEPGSYPDIGRLNNRVASVRRIG